MILIADDNARMRGTIRAMLTHLRHKIIECSDGEEAVKLYAQYHPDWVLMDIRMKPVDGLAATRELKAIDPGARVIIVTNYNDPQLYREAKEAGALAYVLKDDLSQLLSVITKEES